VTVPDVSGMRLEEALSALEAAGVNPGDALGRIRGVVQLTDPRAGSQVRRGSSVDLILA
jgi:beta-lactam-binding protein with PASTA domain